MKKESNLFYYLSTCDTCKRILNELNLPDNVQQINVKDNPISAEELDYLHSFSKSYELLLNKRAQLLRQKGLTLSELKDHNFRSLILEHYTFLKRPILIYKGVPFFGNSKKTIEQAKQLLNE